MLSMNDGLFYLLRVGLKFFSKRAYQLLSSMFQLEDIHVMGAFLHPNYKAPRSASSAQIDNCHQACRRLIAVTSEALEIILDQPDDEPQQKKQKIFLESLMDLNVPTKRKITAQSRDEVDRYIERDLERETFLNPLDFWEKNESK